MAETILCPAHNQPLKIEQEGEVRFAVCACKITGKNPWAGKRVWEQIGAPIPSRQPHASKFEKQEEKSKGE